ncbi:MAG: HTH domain-containing protein [Eubacteriaceae bacterium]|nr:HTH domain-containing protein [Eubacteriaceae bacterium]
MNTIKKDYRLDDILGAIKNGGYRLTAKELAEEFGVDERTIRSDIARIKKDYPQVKTKRGNTGGVYWEGGAE